MSWTEATSILNVYLCSLSAWHSSSYAPKRTSCCSGATPIQWTRRRGVRSDHTVILTSFESASVYSAAFRRVTYLDAETKKRFKFLTNNFTLPAHVIAQSYKWRWGGELFFKW